MQKVKVEWYDTLKGIGEGKTEDDKTVFLNHWLIESKTPNSFLGLNTDEIVTCSIKKDDDGSYFAELIIKE